jgi:hypothetical protein
VSYASESPFPNTFREGLRAALLIIDQHIPSLSDEDDDEIDQLRFSVDGSGDMHDNADLAIRTCHCGDKIDGFYGYVDHLKVVIALETVKK